MTTLDVLIAGRELIADESRWTQGEYARNANGSWATITSDLATCWCSSGALIKVGDKCAAWEHLRLFMGGYIASFNDTHTHAEVLAAWDRAIEAERSYTHDHA